MTTPTLFKEYIWLVNTIHQARNITLNDINRKWLTTEMSGGVELARFDSGNFSIFSLDRIKETEITDETFEVEPDFDAEAFFSECFGVVRVDDVKPEKIVIRAFGTECNYLRDLPLHHSQREIAHTEDYTDFELYLRPTLDLQGQILSRGSRLKVLSPQSLSDKISRTLQEAAIRLRGAA